MNTYEAACKLVGHSLDAALKGPPPGLNVPHERAIAIMAGSLTMATIMIYGLAKQTGRTPEQVCSDCGVIDDAIREKIHMQPEIMQRMVEGILEPRPVH